MKKSLSLPGYPRIPITLLLIVIAVLFKNCETPEEANLVISARQWFENNRGMQWDAWPKVSEGFSIDWSNAVTNGRSIEVPVQLKENLVGYVYDGKESIKGKVSVRLVLWPRSEGYEAVVLEFVHVGGNVPRHLGDINQSRFSGMIKANYGATQKYAALFEDGKQSSLNDDPSMGRLQEIWCLYTIYEHTLPMGEITFTWLTYELQYCFDPTAPQAPLPPDGYWIILVEEEVEVEVKLPGVQGFLKTPRLETSMRFMNLPGKLCDIVITPPRVGNGMA